MGRSTTNHRPPSHSSSSIRHTKSPTAFTLVELLVVIAIIGILVALLLPAVQAAREAARRVQCQNHLKQLGLGATLHHQAHGFFPSGGWGDIWVAEPDQGFGRSQPGGWLSSLLPYIEQQNLFEQGAGGTPQEKKLVAEQLVRTPLEIMNCPSRRPSQLVPHKKSTAHSRRPYNPGVGGLRCNTLTMVARGDYASNSGSGQQDGHAGPTTIAGAETYNWVSLTAFNGISYFRSEIGLAHVRDGSSNTYLFGEKYVSPDHYYDPGNSIGEAQSMYIGQDPDVARTTRSPYTPHRDRAGVELYQHFGSAHAGGCYFVFCDGSVRLINYTIDAQTHENLGNRNDGQAVSLP